MASLRERIGELHLPPPYLIEPLFTYVSRELKGAYLTTYLKLEHLEQYQQWLGGQQREAVLSDGSSSAVWKIEPSKYEEQKKSHPPYFRDLSLGKLTIRFAPAWQTRNDDLTMVATDADHDDANQFNQAPLAQRLPVVNGLVDRLTEAMESDQGYKAYRMRAGVTPQLPRRLTPEP